MIEGQDPGWGTEGPEPSTASSAGVPTALVSDLARLGLDYTGEPLLTLQTEQRGWIFASPRKVPPHQIDTLLERAYRCVLRHSRADARLYLRYWIIARGGKLCIVVGGPPSDSDASIEKT